MTYTETMRAEALRTAQEGIRGNTTATGKRGGVGPGMHSGHRPEAMAEPEPKDRPVEVSFSITKKVGDATLHAYGRSGQEAEAKKAVDEAAAKFKHATKD